MFSAREVFPIAGRAAMIMNCPGLNPPARRSKSINPLETPITGTLVVAIVSMA